MFSVDGQPLVIELYAVFVAQPPRHLGSERHSVTLCAR